MSAGAWLVLEDDRGTWSSEMDDSSFYDQVNATISPAQLDYSLTERNDGFDFDDKNVFGESYVTSHAHGAAFTSDANMPDIADLGTNDNLPGELASHVLDPRTNAFLPPKPCDHCRRNRLQCLTLQTTTANPNPVTACSSCVALFRDCSLTEKEKRQPGQFETVFPVIGHLHGIPESLSYADGTKHLDDHQRRGIGDRLIPINDKRSSSRTRGRTKALRQWFSRHQDCPFPSSIQKTELAIESGLSKTQVDNWFVNARRRQRHKCQITEKQIHLSGSPMPQAFPPTMLPFERWQSSPPDDDHVSADLIEQSIHHDFQTIEQSSSDQSSQYDFTQFDTTYSDSWSTSQDSVASFEMIWSTKSFEMNHLSLDDYISSSSKTHESFATTKIYACTFCKSSFNKKADWSRHETSVHLPLDHWICEEQDSVVWTIQSSQPVCNYCGFKQPDKEHTLSHDFQTCKERQLGERTFGRKDHLLQHMRKFHGCKSWTGQNLDIHRKRRPEVQSRCGFCNEYFSTWPDRVDHLAQHFNEGFRMSQWSGDWGFDTETWSLLRCATLPPDST